MKLILASCCLLLASVASADDQPTAAERISLESGPDTTVISGPLNEDGYPDYVRCLDEYMAAGITLEQNFWTQFWHVTGNTQRFSPEYMADLESKLGMSIPRERQWLSFVDHIFASYSDTDPRIEEWLRQDEESQKRPWTRDEFPEIADWIDLNEEQFGRMHAAAAFPKAYAPIISDREPMLVNDVLLPHCGMARGVARDLMAHAMLSLSEGDEAAAWRDILACHRIAHHCGQGGTMVERLVGIAIHRTAFDPTVYWLSRSTLSAEELQARWQELAPAMEPITFADVINISERLAFVDTVLALQTGRVNSPDMLFGRYDESALAELGTIESETARMLMELRRSKYRLYDLVLIGSDVNETLRYGNRMCDEFCRILSSPDHLERKALLGDHDSELADNRAIADRPETLLAEYFLSSDEDFETLPARMMTGISLSTYSQIEESQTRGEAWSAVLAGAFAIKIVAATNGDVPEDIALPLDPFTGNELILLRDDRGLVLYSVGTDGQDDGGLTYGEHPDERSPEYDDLRAIISIEP